MPYIKIEILIYKSLGYPAEREQLIVGSHGRQSITTDMVKDLFKKMVQVFRKYNLRRKEVKDGS